MLCHDIQIGRAWEIYKQWIGNLIKSCFVLEWNITPLFTKEIWKKGSISNNLAAIYFKSEGLYVKWFKIAG